MKGMAITMKVKTFTMITILLLVFSSAVYAAEWEIKNGELIISGTGKMDNYTKEAPAPWAEKSSEITGLTVKEGITEIGSRCFAGLTKIKTAKLPTTLTAIGERAFYDCSSIEYLKLPNGVRIIGDGAFNSCISVKRIDMPSELEAIGASSFMNMPQITAVTIPQNVSEIGDWAFFGNTSLGAFYFEGKPIQTAGKYISGQIEEDYIIYCPKAYFEEWKTSGLFLPEKISSYNPAERVSVFVNNQEVVFDQQPVIVNGRTLVPVRAIFEAMNAVVGWDSETNTVASEREGTVIKIQIGASVMYKNDKQISIDVPAQIIGDRTFVPVRVISESFGASVEWDNDNRCVNISI